MTQCFPARTLAHAAGVGAAYQRWHQGPVQHLVLDDGTHLTATRNHPIATHVGWLPAWEIRPNHLVLSITDVDGGQPIDRLFNEAAADGVQALRGSPQDFHGDGSSNGPVRAASIGGLLDTSPWHASEGTDPRVETQALLEALAVCIQPNVLGYSNWAQVQRAVPDVDVMWPHGQPLGVDAELGEAARDLPPPVVDHERLSTTLVGVSGQVKLRRVDQAWTGVTGSYVYNLHTDHGAYLAQNVVVGNCG